MLSVIVTRAHHSWHQCGVRGLRLLLAETELELGGKHDDHFVMVWNIFRTVLGCILQT
jgi:hypothetical protein